MYVNCYLKILLGGEGDVLSETFFFKFLEVTGSKAINFYFIVCLYRFSFSPFFDRSCAVHFLSQVAEREWGQ